MPIPNPHTPSEVEVQITALRAIVHAMLREMAGRGNEKEISRIHRVANADIAAIGYSDEFKARAATIVDEVFSGETKHP